jgi:uncharacterized protein
VIGRGLRILGVHFLVQAKDAEQVGARLLDLAEVHWSYLDLFADQLLLRGPTLSGDGLEHTGSIHVLEFSDRAAAERFAFNEPYWLAGLYSDVAIHPVETLVRHPSFEGRSSDDERASSFVTGQWRSSRLAHDSAQLIRVLESNESVIYCGLLVDEVLTSIRGVVAVIDEAPVDASESFQSVADVAAGEVVHLVAQRWRRGGRPLQ